MEEFFKIKEISQEREKALFKTNDQTFWNTQMWYRNCLPNFHFKVYVIKSMDGYSFIDQIFLDRLILRWAHM